MDLKIIIHMIKKFSIMKLYDIENHTTYSIFRLLNENYLYYFQDFNSLNKSKILNDF